MTTPTQPRQIATSQADGAEPFRAPDHAAMDAPRCGAVMPRSNPPGAYTCMLSAPHPDSWHCARGGRDGKFYWRDDVPRPAENSGLQIGIDLPRPAETEPREGTWGIVNGIQVRLGQPMPRREDVRATEAKCEKCGQAIANPTTGLIAGDCAFCGGHMVATKDAWEFTNTGALPEAPPVSRITGKPLTQVDADALYEMLDEATTKLEGTRRWLSTVEAHAKSLEAAAAPVSEAREPSDTAMLDAIEYNHWTLVDRACDDYTNHWRVTSMDGSNHDAPSLRDALRAAINHKGGA